MNKSKNSLRGKILNLTHINTTDSDMERKGHLLGMFLILAGILIAYTTVENLIYFAMHPASREYVAFIIQDVFVAVIFYGFWKLNESGKVQLAAYLSITLSVLSTITFYHPSYLEYMMIVFALPIAISSFIIRPSSSFIYAAFIAIVYTISSSLWDYGWQYNLTAVIALFALAFMTWVIAWRMENAIKENTELVATLKKSNAQIWNAYETTLEGWSLALDLRDKETEGHTQRVTDLTVKLARAIGVSDDELEHIRRGALLHDIGKLGVPDTILLKADKLTEEEWLIMKQHPRYAYSLLYPIQFLRESLDIPCHHHEKWDGSGYPQGMKEDEIPLAARIFAVVDVYDALLYDRPYRKGWAKEKVLNYIKAQSGSHFDPHVVDVFLREIEK
jgi:putative nucleotidyltransferase with HDIG domain